MSFVTFVVNELAPGGAEYALIGEKATPEAIEQVRIELGLNRPWPERYIEFVNKTAHLDFGHTWYGTKEPVIDIIKSGVSMTTQLALMGIFVATTVGMILGVIGAVFQNQLPDRLVMIFSTACVTIPSFVLAPFVVYFFCMKLDLLPMMWEVHRDRPDIDYLILPVGLLSLRPTALITRLTRASMIDTLQQEFIRFAVAKGVPPVKVIFKHGLRNALLPIATGIGLNFAFLLTGSFILETFFGIPGIGREGIDSIIRRDTPVVQAVVIVTATLFTLINLIVDVVLPLLDPRIRDLKV